MATVTKPIALDESINTTEQTPRNIADVLAEELKGIADSITTAESVEDILSDMATTKDAQIISGTAVFDTVDGNLVKALKVAITPSQAGSGTPSPDNIRPIIPWTQEDVLIVGENIFDGVYPSLATAIKYKPIFVGDGEYTLKTTAPRYNNSGCAVFLMAGSTSSGANNDDHGAYNGHPRTQTAIDGYVTIAYRTIGGISPADYVSTIGKSRTYTTPFNQTVYGGTLDVLTGELTIDRGYIKKKWSEFVDRGTLTNNERKDVALAENAVYPPTTSKPQICNLLPYIVQYNLDSPHFYCNNTTAVVFMPIGTDENTEIEIAYELATPQTIQLTPQTVKTLVGENHISASTGDVLECKFSMLINGDDLEMLLS